MIRLAAPESALPIATAARTTPPRALDVPAEDHWLAAVATIAAIMVVIFCSVVMLTADRSRSSPGGGNGRTLPLPTSPAAVPAD